MVLQESQSDSISQPDPRQWKADLARRSLRLAGFLLLAAIPVIACDLAVSAWIKGEFLPVTVRKLLSLSEVFSHGLGAVMILLTVVVLDRQRRHFLPRLAAMSLGAGVLANMMKMLVARSRPYSFDWEGPVTETFQGFLPLTSGGSELQGLPSAHTATAAGLAVALAWLYPRGKWWFAVLATLAACQRVDALSHFPSDVFCGAAVGCFWAAMCLRNGRLGGVFDRLEGRLDRSAEIAQNEDQPPEHPSRAA